MLEKFIFENHLGQRFDGLANGVYLNYNELRDYSWGYATKNNRISRFYRSVSERKMPLVVCCKSDADAAAIKNRLHELAELDIEARKPGKVYIGEYYTTGYITGCVKSNYLIEKRLCYLELTLTSDNPAWFREKSYPFLVGTGSTIEGGTDYPYDYPYDYAVALKGRDIFCDTVRASDFRLLIYGAATDPAITIGGHTYKVNGSVGQGETLLIDSTNKTITLTNAYGSKTNWFGKRDRTEYIFEPIPTGKNIVSWPGDFGFDLIVIEKRSEPKWT